MTPELELLLSGRNFLTQGSSQTTLIYKLGYNLRQFALFELLHDEEACKLLRSINLSFADVAIAAKMPLLIDMDTWRASTNWYNILETPVEQQKITHELALKEAKLVAQYVRERSNGDVDTVIHGTIGPRRDAYSNDENITVDIACEYHREQLCIYKDLSVAVVGAYTMTTSTEALGIALEAKKIDLRCFISFTLDADGMLPSGESLKAAIERVDIESDSWPVFYFVNCIHPKYIRSVAKEGQSEAWINRICGIRGNASQKSHDELVKSTQIDEGDYREYAKELVSLREVLPQLRFFGGCCGTSAPHCQSIAQFLNGV